jgi:recombination protein RecA
MPSAATIRLQIEASLAERIPSALTPAPRLIRPVASTGVPAVDRLLDGGLPVGAITEISGPECSGRSTLAFSFLSQRTHEGKVCAWVDVSNALQPEVAAASRIDLSRLLWVRCGTIPETPASAKVSFQLPKECLTPPPEKKGLYAGGWGAHPRNEIKGLADAVGDLLQSPAPREDQGRITQETRAVQGRLFSEPVRNAGDAQSQLERINQARRVTDLLLQGGGFSAIVLDMGGIAPKYSLRVPLDTWFRYRAAAERTQTSVVLLTQRPCAKSSAGLVLRMGSTEYSHVQAKVFTGLRFHVEVERQRFVPTSNVVPLRKGPQRETGTQWDSRCSWAARR